MNNGKKILIVVEDDGMLRKIMADKFKTFGYEVFQAEDGQVAVDAILDKKPDLVLLDLLIPKVDGFLVLEKIRNYPDAKIAQTPVVVLSNLWSDKDILRVKSLKIDDYFVKANTDMNQFYEKVQALLAKAG
ncbi:MAG: response regulator [Patescibacteria group bacterium]|mgnify:FL=1